MAASTNPQIGSYIFINRQGPDPLPPVMTVSEITRPNIDGHAFVEEGKRSDPVVWITIVDTNAPDTLIDSYRALQGTLVTVICPDGKSISNVMVKNVARLGAKFTKTPVGGITPGGAWILTAKWELQPC